MFLTVAVEEPVPRLPEELPKKATKKYPTVFVQSCSKTFTVAVYSKLYKFVKKDLKKRIIHYLFVLCYREAIF